MTDTPKLTPKQELMIKKGRMLGWSRMHTLQMITKAMQQTSDEETRNELEMLYQVMQEVMS